jgi:predicted TIM-barrel fold metal-dependent hydrolase
VKMNIIDPHLHLFALESGNYHWLKAENPPFWPDKQLINKTFDETDLSLEWPLFLSGFVHIEAGFDNEQPWRELSALETSCNTPFSSIANIDLKKSNQQVNSVIEKLTKLQSFVGVRHLLDDQALMLLSNKQLLNNMSTLNEKGLVFEVQLSLIDQMPVAALSAVIENNLNMRFIINHAGFPPNDIRSLDWQRWHSNLTKLSLYPHVAIKCSGWEMTDRNYQTSWLNENLSQIFATFGAKKIMLASNFPLCLFNHESYQAYWQSIISSDFFQVLTEQERSALCYNNTLHWYGMNGSVK